MQLAVSRSLSALSQRYVILGARVEAAIGEGSVLRTQVSSVEQPFNPPASQGGTVKDARLAHPAKHTPFRYVRYSTKVMWLLHIRSCIANSTSGQLIL